MRRLAIAVGLAAGLSASACSPFHAYSPGTRLGTVEGPGTLLPGQHSVALSGGYAGAMSFGFNDDSVSHFALRGRAGLARNVDAAFDVAVSETVARAFDPTSSCVSTSCSETVRRTTFHTRAGIKYEVAPRVLSFVAGVGLGTSELGEFFSPDIGFVVGYENPYFVPFASWTIGFSLPFNSRNVTVAHVTDTAHRTRIQQYTFGYRVPIGERISETGRRFNLGAAMTFTSFDDSARSDLYFGFAFAFETVIN